MNKSTWLDKASHYGTLRTIWEDYLFWYDHRSTLLTHNGTAWHSYEARYTAFIFLFFFSLCAIQRLMHSMARGHHLALPWGLDDSFFLCRFSFFILFFNYIFILSLGRFNVKLMTNKGLMMRPGDEKKAGHVGRSLKSRLFSSFVGTVFLFGLVTLPPTAFSIEHCIKGHRTWTLRINITILIAMWFTTRTVSSTSTYQASMEVKNCDVVNLSMKSQYGSEDLNIVNLSIKNQCGNILVIQPI